MPRFKNMAGSAPARLPQRASASPAAFHIRYGRARSGRLCRSAISASTCATACTMTSTARAAEMTSDREITQTR